MADSERTQQLTSRGTIVPGVDLVMALLQRLYPRREFPEAADGERYQAVASLPWTRGGTSPGGAKLRAAAADEQGKVGNYFIGWADAKSEEVGPQRAVWLPPEPGQERFGPAGWTGFQVDASVDPGAPQLLQPGRPDLLGEGDPATQPPGRVAGPAARMHGQYAAAAVRTRVIPMTCYLWGLDLDDTEELAHWTMTACETVWQGCGVGEPVCVSGGIVRDEKQTKGLHYVLVANFFAPVIFPPLWEQELRAAALQVYTDREGAL